MYLGIAVEITTRASRIQFLALRVPGDLKLHKTLLFSRHIFQPKGLARFYPAISIHQSPQSLSLFIAFSISNFLIMRRDSQWTQGTACNNYMLLPIAKAPDLHDVHPSIQSSYLLDSAIWSAGP
jgi:hypothetical protein